MVEIALHHTTPGADYHVGEEIRFMEPAQEEQRKVRAELRANIYHAIPPEGITPEEVFELVMVKAEWNRSTVAPHEFFLAIVYLLGQHFISASTRAVGSA